MTRIFDSGGKADAGDVLAFLHGALAAGDDAAVPACALPALAVSARLQPDGRGALAGHFVFSPASPPRPVWRAGERAAALGLLLLLSPLFALLALLVRAVDGGPAFFVQERFGWGGRPFRMVKFRTMVPNSERLHGRLQRRHGRAGHLFKLEDDPRVTRLGARLRRTFLDELPQLVNVARGEMGLVGPRPLPASDQSHYTRAGHALRLNGLPGMTGLWQVSGRNARSFDEMCLLDLYYLGRQSWALDARILLRTAGLLLQQARVKREAENRGQ